MPEEDLHLSDGAPSRTHERVLSHEEIRRLWKTWEADDRVTSDALMMLLVTGQRKGEVLTMRWDQIDEHGWWTIPGAVAKNKRTHRVFLAPLAQELLAKRRTLRQGAWVYPSRYKADSPTSALNKTTARTVAVSGVRGWCPHDLRRTAASLMASIGVPVHIIEIILNHSPAGVTRRHYDHYAYDREVEAAMIRWAEHLERILADAEGDVLPFRHRQAR